MNKRRGWMPGLDLLAEDYGEFRRVFSGQKGKDRCVDGVEHLCGEGADIVEVLTSCQYDRG